MVRRIRVTLRLEGEPGRLPIDDAVAPGHATLTIIMSRLDMMKPAHTTANTSFRVRTSAADATCSGAGKFCGVSSATRMRRPCTVASSVPRTRAGECSWPGSCFNVPAPRTRRLAPTSATSM